MLMNTDLHVALNCLQGNRLSKPLSVQELMLRSNALCGHSVAEVARELNTSIPEDLTRSKGFVGQLLELALGADPQALDRPDFPDLGVELKTIPLSEAGTPVESTFCCSIDMEYADRVSWETSRLRTRLSRVLFIGIDSVKVEAGLGARIIRKVMLWEPNAAEHALLRADWEDLIGFIGAGRGAILNAKKGDVIQVRPKAADSKVRTLSPGSEGLELSLPLGFYLRAKTTLRLFQRGTIVTEGRVES